MSDGNSDQPVIQDEVMEEINSALSEEEIIGMYHGGQSSEERVPLIEQFAPGENQWGGKTILREGQPRNLTLAEHLTDVFPVLLPSEDYIKNVIRDYEMRRTSIEGVGRDQLRKIFQAMFGANAAEDEEGRGVVRLALSGGPEDD